MAIAVIAISGCRPQELAYGVKLSLNEDESIHVYIHGAKTHQGLYGQMFRSFDIKDDSIEFGYLRELLQSHGAHLISNSHYDANRLNWQSTFPMSPVYERPFWKKCLDL